MYVAEMIEQLKISPDLKSRIIHILDDDDTYSLELQEYLQKIYKIEKETIELLRIKEAEQVDRQYFTPEKQPV
jgi:hypothetical protein